MIASLSQLLRESLDAGTVDRVPLARELDLLERYVDIQRARFGDRLDVGIEVDSGRARRARADPDSAAAGGELDPPRARGARHRRPDPRCARCASGDRLVLEVRGRRGGARRRTWARAKASGWGTRGRGCSSSTAPGAQRRDRNADGGGALVRLTMPWQRGHARGTDADDAARAHRGRRAGRAAAAAPAAARRAGRRGRRRVRRRPRAR